MTLGEKIRLARKQAGITQYALAGDKITRNMLSCIENNTANPSLDTLRYLADTLRLPIEYLISEDESLFIHLKNRSMPSIKALLEKKDYKGCIDEAEKLGDTDDELAYLLAEACTKHGRELLLGGSLSSANNSLKKALDYSKKTLYDTRRFENIIPMYIAICENIQTPLLEFDTDSYENGLDVNEDYEFFKYMTLDYSFEFKNETYARHLQAKRLIKERNYAAALEIMRDIVENRKYKEYNSYLMYGVYIDMENCYKQLFDFENAYRYSSKRISLMEGFKG